MKKILTKKQRLEKYISKAIICNASKMSEHCLTQCKHGRLHEKEIEKDGCHRPEFCSLSNSGIIKVTCKPLTKKAQKQWLEKELKK